MNLVSMQADFYMFIFLSNIKYLQNKPTVLQGENKSVIMVGGGAGFNIPLSEMHCSERGKDCSLAAAEKEGGGVEGGDTEE